MMGDMQGQEQKESIPFHEWKFSFLTVCVSGTL